MNRKQNVGSPTKTALQRAMPPLAFLLAICLLVICCHDSGHTSLPPTEKRYITAKAGVATLRQDAKKKNLREPWEKLATEFRSIYDADPAWPNRPAALFRAAESLEELAKRSFARSDARKAITCYETLALRHAQSRLADDSLFRAAQMRAAWLKDDAGALALLARIKKQYPKGDMVANANALEKAIRASASGKTDTEAVKAVTRATTDTLDDIPVPAKTSKKVFADNLPLKFNAVKSRADALGKDAIKSCWRQPWENLRNEFLALSQEGKKDLVPASLYEAAMCQKKLAVCSRLSKDSKKAIELFQKVATRFPKNSRAPKALLEVARLQAKLADDKNAASATLAKITTAYPKNAAAAEARKMQAKLEPPQKPARSGVKAAARSAELQVLSWDSINKNSVEIVLEMSAPAPYATRLEKATATSPPRLILDLDNASVVNDVRKGVTVNGSLLKAVRVKDRKGGTSLQFDFRDVRRFDARREEDPCRIILTVAAGKTPLPNRRESRRTIQAEYKKAIAPKSRLKGTEVNDLACQLGLTVQRVFIDAGHGGKDPGTSHNKIVEKHITLDVATTLGRLLQTNGLEVVYSRTTDKTVALSERTRMANVAHADLFVSIHINANDNAAASGFETYFLDLASNSQAARVAMLENATSDKRLGDMQSMLAEVMLHARANESRNLATDVQRVSLFRLKKHEYRVRNNGVKSAPFHVLLGARMPAVLVELGYCSNAAEASSLASPKYRQALAEGLAEGILAYRDRLLRNRTAGKSLTHSKAGAI